MINLMELGNDLRSNVTQIHDVFLAKYFPADPSHTPETYQHDVKAYCILTHAMFEEFVETISLELMRHAADAWLNSRQSSDPLLALCMSYKTAILIEEDEEAIQDRAFDAIRKAIEDAKVAHSKTVFNNQGFSLKYLRNLLTPVAIDVTSDAKSTSSLRTLADARGSYAHSLAKSAYFTDRKRAKKPMTPESARDIVSDCLDLCLNIAASAGKYFPPPPAPQQPAAAPAI